MGSGALARKPLGYVSRDAAWLPSPDDITLKQELFAQAVIRLGNQMAAYREVFNVDPRCLPQSVWQAASKLATQPDVAARIYELKQQAAALSLVDNAIRLQELREIESADPREIIAVLTRSCRHCHGVNHAYQWKDENEFMEAYIKALDTKQPVPSDAGGFGFERAQHPTVDCPHCLGLGEREVDVKDARQFTRGARLLYKGAKVKADGSIEILMHDQMQARDQLNKILGLYKTDTSGLGAAAAAGAAAAVTATAVKEVETMTVEQLERKYLELVS